ncbi:MAG: hypothetical protein GX967_04290 [Clostridiales bacterium]|nr:hypothetical protein [Clostridiales bacterium]
MGCRKCGSDNINFQIVAKQKKRGCLMSIFWILLTMITLGATIWIPLLIRKGSKVVTYGVCQNCGYRWKA